MANNTTSTRKTQRDFYNELMAIPAVAENVELVEFIEGRIAQLDKKNSAERKPTAKQTENEGYKTAILGWMEQGQSYAMADIHKGVPAIVDGGISANRVTAILTQLVTDGKIVRTTDKRKSVYTLA